MRRTAVGIIALVLLATAVYGFYRDGFGNDESSFFWNSCWRIGLVLAAAWFALPELLEQKTNASPMVLALAGLVGLVIVVRPRTIVFLWPILVILVIVQFFHWLVRPPAKKTARGKRKSAGQKRL